MTPGTGAKKAMVGPENDSVISRLKRAGLTLEEAEALQLPRAKIIAKNRGGQLERWQLREHKEKEGDVRLSSSTRVAGRSINVEATIGMRDGNLVISDLTTSHGGRLGRKIAGKIIKEGLQKFVDEWEQ